MCCITSCLCKIFCCSGRKIASQEKKNVIEEKVVEVSRIRLTREPLKDHLKKKLSKYENAQPPIDHIDRATHNRFMSTDVITINMALKE